MKIQVVCMKNADQFPGNTFTIVFFFSFLTYTNVVEPLFWTSIKYLNKWDWCKMNQNLRKQVCALFIDLFFWSKKNKVVFYKKYFYELFLIMEVLIMWIKNSAKIWTGIYNLMVSCKFMNNMHYMFIKITIQSFLKLLVCWLFILNIYYSHTGSEKKSNTTTGLHSRS